jgi:putative transcriptional regulator
VPIVVRLDIVMARRKIRGQELAERIGLTQANLSKLKTGRIKAIRFSTLEGLCAELGCQPGDLLEYVADGCSTGDQDEGSEEL